MANQFEIDTSTHEQIRDSNDNLEEFRMLQPNSTFSSGRIAIGEFVPDIDLVDETDQFSERLDHEAEDFQEDAEYIADIVSEHGDFRNDFKRGRVQEILEKHVSMGPKSVAQLIEDTNRRLKEMGNDLTLEYEVEHLDQRSVRNGINVGVLPAETIYSLRVMRPGESEPEDMVTYRVERPINHLLPFRRRPGSN